MSRALQTSSQQYHFEASNVNIDVKRMVHSTATAQRVISQLRKHKQWRLRVLSSTGPLSHSARFLPKGCEERRLLRLANGCSGLSRS